jgi:hypothetical protein
LLLLLLLLLRLRPLAKLLLGVDVVSSADVLTLAAALLQWQPLLLLCGLALFE